MTPDPPPPKKPRRDPRRKSDNLGRPPGTTSPNTKDTVIVLRVTRQRKGAYVATSRAAKTTLSDWMQTQCDAAALAAGNTPT